MSQLAESLESLADLLDPIGFAESVADLADVLEAKGEYVYDYENVKRWVLGSGGKSGNCETCNDNADMDWIPDDDVFFDVEGNEIDEPPAHPNCTCSVEYKEKRVRVYV